MFSISSLLYVLSFFLLLAVQDAVSVCSIRPFRVPFNIDTYDGKCRRYEHSICLMVAVGFSLNCGNRKGFVLRKKTRAS